MTSRSLINFVLFQGVWFMALFLENTAILPGLTVICLMFYLSKQKQQDAILLSYGLLIALGFEWLATQLQLLSFNILPLPAWLVMLWAALLLTLNTSMDFLTRLPWYFAVLACSVFAPASYLAGARFGVLNIEVPVWQFWSVYGVMWAIMFFVIMLINKRVATYLATVKKP
ncbi:DUF2878 domain-containing protein (plasmid) [Pseudoalteromonas mariniglutinosa]